MGTAVRNDRRIIFVAMVLSAGIFLLDLSIPLGVAGGVPYVAVVLLSLWSSKRRHTLLFAAGTSLLTILGLAFSQHGGILWMVYFNRFLALFAIWVTALLSLSRKQVEEELREHRLHLEDKVAERTAELDRYREHLEELVLERTQELETAQAELLRSERMAALGQVTATVAHEIRNPLGTVRNSVYSIADALERNEVERIASAVRLAERNILRCDGIITELLDFTRRRDLTPQDTDMDLWLETLLEEYEFPEGIVCARELNSNTRLAVDREHLRRAVINVVSNAVQALQEDDTNGNDLSVEIRESSERLEMRFADSGPGIPEDAMGHIFEPLFSTKSFGVGLGIPIIKDIMEQHRGGVEYRTKLGKGTTVTLWLPLAAQKE